MTQRSVALLDEVATGFTLQGILVAIGIILGVAVAFVITRMVTGPLNQTVAALQDVARGDGDLTHRIDVKSADEFGDLAQGFNEFSQKLQSLIIDVSECCSHLISAAQEMLDEVNNTRQGVTSQNQKIDQISAAIETMTQKVRDVAGHTGEAAQLAEETNQDALEGRNVVEQSLESSDRLAADVDQAAAVINDLEKDVEAIGGILDVIRGVADQTNLLALNAAIEAARAGEQGRGFAVVADEVRTLASRTQASTAEIQTMIQRLQSGSQQAVEVMTDGRNKSQEGLEHARQAGTSLHKISSAAEGMLAMNREIAGATEAQGEHAGEINKNVAAINELARQTATSSDVMAQTSGRVNELAMQLKSLIGQFRV
jgi:methyl-accepting chemotaxis protein